MKKWDAGVPLPEARQIIARLENNVVMPWRNDISLIDQQPVIDVSQGMRG